MIQWIVLVLACLAANAPWFSNRLFYVWSISQQPKSFFWYLLEVIVLYFVVGGIARYAEYQTMGQVATQHWEYYAVTACLFLVLSFPGFAYRYLWLSPKSRV